MDRKIYAGAGALLILAAAACTPGGQDVTTGASAAQPAATSADAMPAVTAPAAPLDTSRGEALAFLVAINEHYVAAAEQARGKKIDKRVRAYADTLHAEHMQNLEQTHAVAAKADASIKDSAEVSNFRARGLADLERMAALDEDDYADAYLQAMASGHAEAVALIDDHLLPAAADAAVRQHLAATRSHMVHHLLATRDLQGKRP